MNTIFEKTNIISSYSRTQALADGALVDVSKIAREAGIIFPVAVTAAVWIECVAWNEADAAFTGTIQDEAGRLWDVLWMRRHAIMTSGNRDRIIYRGCYFTS